MKRMTEQEATAAGLMVVELPEQPAPERPDQAVNRVAAAVNEATKTVDDWAAGASMTAAEVEHVADMLGMAHVELEDLGEELAAATAIPFDHDSPAVLADQLGDLAVRIGAYAEGSAPTPTELAGTAFDLLMTVLGLLALEMELRYAAIDTTTATDDLAVAA